MGPSSVETVSVIALRGLLRLVSDLKDLPDGSAEQRRLALEGLARVIGAKVSLWVDVTVGADGFPLLACPIDLGWSTAGERAAFRYYLDQQRACPDPASPRLAQALTSPQTTLSRHDVIEDRDWYSSEHVQDIRRAAGVDSFVQSVRICPGGRVTSIGLHRPWGDRPFSPRERAILDVFRTETPWLDTAPPGGASVPFLSPRQASVLAALQRGLSEKEVAAELSLSQHTTHDHVKALYRRFQVRSRSELLALTLGPRPPASNTKRP